MGDEDTDAEGRGGDLPRRRSVSGFEDNFWLVLLGLIVVGLFLFGLMSGGTDGGGHDPGYTGWH
ncbi:hypothetical protein [Streptomyces sp. NPDC096030]|uniref:hypothetical protein n=1 Tax=Streptomyces sp. NPDC096030 TaxID=3155423 RepID=UPI0033244E04